MVALTPLWSNACKPLFGCAVARTDRREIAQASQPRLVPGRTELTDQAILKPGRQVDWNASMLLWLRIAKHVDIDSMFFYEHLQQLGIAGDVGALCRPRALVPVHAPPELLGRLAKIEDLSVRHEGVEHVRGTGQFV